MTALGLIACAGCSLETSDGDGAAGSDLNADETDDLAEGESWGDDDDDDAQAVDSSVEDQAAGGDIEEQGSTCVPLTCEDMECGSYDDGCGNPIDCGACSIEVDAASRSGANVNVTFATANIGRASFQRTKRSIHQVKQEISQHTPAKAIGWQEISGGFECGLGESHPCERGFIRDDFPKSGNWNNFWIKNDQTDVQVPISLKGMGSTIRTRKVLAHKTAKAYGTTGSPRRQVTVAYSKEHNISFLNTHLISAAWSCKKSAADRKKRRTAWQEGWKNIKKVIAEERGRGRNVVFVGDLNRSQRSNPCNPSWKAAASLNDHPGIKHATRINGGPAGAIDYIIAVPAPGQRWKYERRDNGSIKRGVLSKDPMEGFHPGYWVRGKFRPN